MMKEIAGKILNYIYNIEFQENRKPDLKELSDISELEKHQLEMALKYCKKKNYLKYSETFGDIFSISMLPVGIDLISNEDKFKKQFGFGVNLGLVNFRWGAQER